MSLTETLIGLLIAATAGAWAWWREKNYIPGRPPLIPYTYIQFTALIVIIVMIAHLISITTGITWQSPFAPRT